jgi:hypothetical protein
MERIRQGACLALFRLGCWFSIKSFILIVAKAVVTNIDALVVHFQHQNPRRVLTRN